MTQTETVSSLDAEQVGYKQTLGRRQVQMIALGGAIGTGLFLGSASRLHSTGPALLFSYAFVGVIAYFLMRALGELVLHRPTSGAFVSYMREFFGEAGAYVTGWMYWLNWALTGIAELSAVGLYIQYWFPTVPTWLTVLIALAVVLVVNLLSARAFGEFEFWASVLKVTAIVVFLLVGTVVVVFGMDIGGHSAGFSNLWSNPGGFWPSAGDYVWYGPILVMSGVVFAYASHRDGRCRRGGDEGPRPRGAEGGERGDLPDRGLLLRFDPAARLDAADDGVHRRHEPVRDGLRAARSGLDGHPDPGGADHRGDVEPQLRPLLDRPGAAEPRHVEAGAGLHAQDEQPGRAVGGHRDDLGRLRLRARCSTRSPRTPSRSPSKPPRSAWSSPGRRSSSARSGCGSSPTVA